MDPLRPQVGMVFTLISQAYHFVFEYERRRRYRWRQGESQKSQDGMFTRFLRHWVN